jgi:hypothetical protein
MFAYRSSATVLAHFPDPIVLVDPISSTIFTIPSHQIVFADRSSSARFAILEGPDVQAQSACIHASCMDGLARALQAAEGGLILDGLAADAAGCVGTHDWLALLTHVEARVQATTIVTSTGKQDVNNRRARRPRAAHKRRLAAKDTESESDESAAEGADWDECYGVRMSPANPRYVGRSDSTCEGGGCVYHT